MNIHFWDKKTTINDIDAQEFLASMPHLKNGRVITIADTNGTITQVESVDVLTANLKIDTTNMSAQEIYETYINNLEKTSQTEIEAIKAQLKTTQEAVDFLLMGGM